MAGAQCAPLQVHPVIVGGDAHIVPFFRFQCKLGTRGDAPAGHDMGIAPYNGHTSQYKH